MNRDEVEDEFRKVEGKYQKLMGEVLFILHEETRNRNIQVHDILGRVKSFDSFYGKVKRKELTHPFADVIDVVGIRIICLFLNELGPIADMLSSVFHVLSQDVKVENTQLNMFGYMSNHYVATLSEGHMGQRYDDILGLPFEVQVRTIAMDAWANVSHHLAYKQESDVPSELRRDFFALSGLFYIADMHFQMFWATASGSRQEAHAAVSNDRPNFRDSELNIDTIMAVLAYILPDRHEADFAAYSELLSDLRESEFKSVGQLEDSLLKGVEGGAIRSQPESNSSRKPNLDRVSAARKILLETNRNFKRKRDVRIRQDLAAYLGQVALSPEIRRLLNLIDGDVHLTKADDEK